MSTKVSFSSRYLWNDGGVHNSFSWIGGGGYKPITLIMFFIDNMDIGQDETMPNVIWMCRLLIISSHTHSFETSAQQVPEPDPTLFIYENHRVAGNPKYLVLPNLSERWYPIYPEIPANTRKYPKVRMIPENTQSIIQHPYLTWTWPATWYFFQYPTQPDFEQPYLLGTLWNTFLKRRLMKRNGESHDGNIKLMSEWMTRG